MKVRKVKMMTSETVRATSGLIIGRIEHYDDGRKVFRDYYGKIIASYDPYIRATRSVAGNIIGYGDIGAGLLFDPRYNKTK